MAGLSTMITGPEGSGRFEAAATLHARRFPSGQLHRVHAASASLPPLIENLRKTLAQKGGREQTLVIEAFEQLPKDLELDLIDLVRTGTGAKENFLLVGISQLSLDELCHDCPLGAELLHSLSVLPISMPPLAARSDDISLFADIYLSHLSARQSGFAGHLTPEARAMIRAQPWPDNLPQLRSAVMRAAILAEDPSAIGGEDMSRAMEEVTKRCDGPSSGPRGGTAEAGVIAPVWRAIAPLLDTGYSIDEVLAALEDHALAEAQGNISAASRRLGLSRAKLDYRLKARG